MKSATNAFEDAEIAREEANEPMVYVGTPDGSGGYEIPARELNGAMERNAIVKLIEDHESFWEHGEADIGNPDYLSCLTCEWTAPIEDSGSERRHLADAILAAGFTRQSPASTTAADAWDEGFNTPSDGPLYDIGLRAQNPYRVAAPEGDGGNE